MSEDGGEKKNDGFKKTNASPSAYGWEFQVGAGIVLMLDYAKEFTSLKMEGKDDDIEITIPGGKVYAQAKSVYQMRDQRSAVKNLGEALTVLYNDAKKDPDHDKLIYVTNIVNPFDGTQNNAYSTYDRVYDYAIIAETEQQKIMEHTKSDFPTDDLQVRVLWFFGEKERKYDSVKRRVRDFLDEAELKAFNDNELLRDWTFLFHANCADVPDEKKRVEMSKKEVMYPVIMLATKGGISRNDFSEVSDYENYEEIYERYRESINNRAYEYDFTASLLAEYQIEKGKVPKDDLNGFMYKFVRENYANYRQYFDGVDEEPETKDQVIMMTLLTIIKNAGNLKKIYNATNLNNI